MTRTLVASAAGLLLCSAAAMAQTPANTASPGHAPAMNGTPMRTEVTDSLKNAGFSDVKVVPDSFFVQAKDKSGNPVSMLISPNSVTELVNQGGQGMTNGGAAAGQQGGVFVSSTTGDTLGSKLIGTDVHNANNQAIGSIKDVAMRNGQVQAYVLDVGGFLGMGDHYVAVAPQAVTINRDAGSKTVHATMNVTEAELRAAPAFQYPAT